MIVVFGGAFNPPTIAHDKVARHVLRLPAVEGLIFVPVGDQYEKVGLISATHRIKMLELLTKNLPKAVVSKVEVQAERALKSIETLERLQLEYPHSDLAFIMGADNLSKLLSWHDYKRLVKTFNIMVINRGELDVHAFIKVHFPKQSHRFIIMDDFSKLNISSSSYRTDTTRSEILLPEVETYVKANDLYQYQKIK